MGRRKAPAYDANFLTPLKTEPRITRFLVVDIESKAGNIKQNAEGNWSPSNQKPDSQHAGFERPFLAGVFDPTSGAYEAFRDEPHLRAYSDTRSSFWGARHYAPGGCIDKALNYILSPKFNGFNVYAHNGGGFDFLFFLRWLRIHHEAYEFEIVPVQSSIQVLRVTEVGPEGRQAHERESSTPKKKKKGKRKQPKLCSWTFLDSMKLLPMGLQKAAKAFGVKGKLDHDLNRHEDDPSWEAYLEQDCRALAEVLSRFHHLIEKKLGGEVGVTTPATSMRLYRRAFMGKGTTPKLIPRYRHWETCDGKDPVTGEPCLGCFHQWIRYGYYGGRTELFEFRATKLRYYDLNSSYVYAMTQPMPAGRRLVQLGGLDWRMLDKNVGFCECTVQIPEDCKIPPLPYKCPDSGKLLFPAGTFKGVWSVDELKLLEHPLVRGKILHIEKTVWIGKKRIFSEFVAKLWAYRQKCLPGCTTKNCKGCDPNYDEGLSLLGKLLGNGHYGKYAQDPERTRVIIVQYKDEGICFLCDKSLPGAHVSRSDTCVGAPIFRSGGVLETPVPKPRSRNICKDCEGSKSATGDPDVDFDVWYQRKQQDAPYIIPQIAAQITTLARIRLWENMARVIELGGKITYTDTDSIICNVELPTSNELGDLKDEYPGHSLTFWGIQPKAYVLTSKKLDEKALEERFDISALGNVSREELMGLAHEEGAKVTMKGFPAQAPRRLEDVPKDEEPHANVPIRDLPTFKRLAEGDVIRWRRLEKVRSLAKLGISRPPRMADVEKSIKSKYTKRIINDDGNTTRPLVLTPGVAALTLPGMEGAPSVIQDSDPNSAVDDESDLPF